MFRNTLRDVGRCLMLLVSEKMPMLARRVTVITLF